jgi:Carboxypeptidase regulatory-like domain
MTNRTHVFTSAAQSWMNLPVTGFPETWRIRSKHLSVVLSLATVLSACNGSDRSPTSASASPPTAGPTYTLSGAVSEETPAGPAPVEGARVETSAPYGFAMTDAKGFYKITGLRAISSSVTVTKSGYVTGLQTVTIQGDTQLDFQVNRIASFTLSGMVFEATPEGQMPIEGVELYCDGCGSPVGHTSVFTDADGFYSFAWTFNGPNPLFVTKAGYAIVDPTGTLKDAYGRVTATVKGDTRFDIELIRR